MILKRFSTWNGFIISWWAEEVHLLKLTGGLGRLKGGLPGKLNSPLKLSPPMETNYLYFKEDNVIRNHLKLCKNLFVQITAIQ